MNEADRVRLLHMRDAAREAALFSSEATRTSLITDLKLVRALSMSIGIIGEAAANVSVEFREAHPDIPWRQIIGMQNFLIHAYFNIDLDILWNTATRAVPDLIAQLDELLAADSD